MGSRPALVNFKKFLTIVIAILSGVGGCLFGTTITKSHYMGTDPIIFGLLGSFISFFLYNMKAIQKISNNDKSICCFLLIFVFLIILMGFSSNTFYRLGGILNGGLIGVVFCRSLDTGENSHEMGPTGWKKYLNAKVIFGVVFAVMNLVFLILLFT